MKCPTYGTCHISYGWSLKTQVKECSCTRRSMLKTSWNGSRCCNATNTPFKTWAKLKREINDEFVNVTLYKQITGSLRYLCNTRPDICQRVDLLSMFIEKPWECHLTAVKKVLRCIKGTINNDVLMQNKKNMKNNAEMYCYTNSDFSGDRDEKKSIAGYIFMFFKALIYWIKMLLQGFIARHYIIILMWGWVCRCILCSTSSIIDIHVTWRAQDHGT